MPASKSCFQEAKSPNSVTQHVFRNTAANKSSNLLMKLLWPPHFTWKTANFTVLCVTFFINDEILGGKFSQYSFLKGLEGWGGVCVCVGGGGGVEAVWYVCTQQI